MYVHKITQIIIILLLFGFLAACGHPISAAPSELIQQKKAILILTSPTLDKSLEIQLAQTLNTWKQSDLIAYEWIQQVNVVDDLLVKKINNKAYSYIIVLGKDLTPTTLTSALLTKAKRWIVLSDATHPEAIPSTLPDNIALYQLSANVANYNSVSTLTYQFMPMSNIQMGTIVLLWDNIWAEQLKVIQLNSFDHGIHYYNAQQMRVNH